MEVDRAMLMPWSLDYKLKKALNLKKGEIPFLFVILRRHGDPEESEVFFDIAVSDVAKQLTPELEEYMIDRIRFAIKNIRPASQKGDADMSKWTHSICDDCWDKERPNQKSSRSGSGKDEICCFCEKPNNSGIYIRQDPKSLLCKGRHQE